MQQSNVKPREENKLQQNNPQEHPPKQEKHQLQNENKEKRQQPQKRQQLQQQEQDNLGRRPKAQILMSCFVYGHHAMNSRRMRLFLKSVATCGMDYVLMGDAPPENFALPPNVIHVFKSWNDLVDDIHRGLVPPTKAAAKAADQGQDEQEQGDQEQQL
jgi:hypothetical protein